MIASYRSCRPEDKEESIVEEVYQESSEDKEESIVEEVFQEAPEDKEESIVEEVYQESPEDKQESIVEVVYQESSEDKEIEDRIENDIDQTNENGQSNEYNSDEYNDFSEVFLSPDNSEETADFEPDNYEMSDTDVEEAKVVVNENEIENLATESSNDINDEDVTTQINNGINDDVNNDVINDYAINKDNVIDDEDNKHDVNDDDQNTENTEDNLTDLNVKDDELSEDTTENCDDMTDKEDVEYIVTIEDSNIDDVIEDVFKQGN